MRKATVWLMIALSVLLLVGCSSSSSSVPSQDASTSAGKASSSTQAVAAKTSNESTGSATTEWDRYVIRTANIVMTVKDVETTAEQIKTVATQANGYVAQSNIRREGQQVIADISIQVPAQSLDVTISDLRRLAVTVDQATISSQDVTEEFVDNESRLGNLKAAEESTQRLLDKASKMEDILSIQKELTTIRGDIEKIQGRQNYLKRRVDMSTITVHLASETSTILAADRSEWQPLNTARDAWEASLTFVSKTIDVLVALIVFLWWAFPLAAIVWWIWRRRRRGNSKQSPPKPAAQSQS